MIYAIVNKETNIVIGCDLMTPEKYIPDLHPQNTIIIPIKKNNSPVQLGYIWNEETNDFYPPEEVNND